MAWVEKIAQHSWRVRHRRDGGVVESLYGFDNADAAQEVAGMLDGHRRHGSWLTLSDERTTVITLADWVCCWWPTLDLDTRTVENYRSYLRCHILPRFGTLPIAAIAPLDIRMWSTEALEAGYAPATVGGWKNLLSMIFADAVDEGLVAANPVRKHRRRGRRARHLRPERIWATPDQVLAVAEQAGMLGGPTARLLIITAAWTGCRWGELTGLHRDNVDLHRGVITIDTWEGALHESSGKRWIGPPKTASSARRIHLPPFLTELLRKHLNTHPYEYVFTTESGTWLWRSTFTRRILRPAADGNLGVAKPAVRTHPACPGLTFHGLRHSHNTWMISDDIPEIARARRLGHHTDNRIAETYSHVSGEIHQRLLASLEHRWHTANTSTSTEQQTDPFTPERSERPAPPAHCDGGSPAGGNTSTMDATQEPAHTVCFGDDGDHDRAAALVSAVTPGRIPARRATDRHPSRRTRTPLIGKRDHASKHSIINTKIAPTEADWRDCTPAPIGSPNTHGKTLDHRSINALPAAS